MFNIDIKCGERAPPCLLGSVISFCRGSFIQSNTAGPRHDAGVSYRNFEGLAWRRHTASMFIFARLYPRLQSPLVTPRHPTRPAPPVVGSNAQCTLPPRRADTTARRGPAGRPSQARSVSEPRTDEPPRTSSVPAKVISSCGIPPLVLPHTLRLSLLSPHLPPTLLGSTHSFPTFTPQRPPPPAARAVPVAPRGWMRCHALP